MKVVMSLAVAVVLLSAVATQRVAGQIPVGTKVGETPRSAGTYESLGNRDPFVSLITPRRAAGPNTPRVGGRGLGSFYVTDVLVTGIVRKGDTMMAILQSPDKQSYVAKVRDRLADAVVKSIDTGSVVFVELAEPGNPRPREIRKLLRAVDEVNR
jgi:Tfp pilus assembly protein PilP